MDRAIVKLKQLILLSGDLAIFYLALWAALIARGLFPRTVLIGWSGHVVPFSIVFLAWLIIFYTNGLYDLAAARNEARFLRKAAAGFAAAAIAAVAFFYLVPFFWIEPRTTLAFDLLITSALWILWRTIFNATIASRALRTRVCFIGWNPEAAELTRIIHARPNVGYQVAAVVAPNVNPTLPSGSSIAIKQDFSRLSDFLRSERVATVVMAMSPRTTPELARPLYESIFLKLAFTDIIPFYEQLTGRIPVSAITRIWFLENLREAEKRFYDVIKRAGDLAMAAAIGIFTIAISPLVAAAISVNSRGPIFYRQERVGKDGKPFRIVKFRTMVRDAETNGAQFASKDDSRVTRVGRFLRAARIDELPQVWNVIRGEMSFIGPRPERPEFVRQLEEAMPFYSMRHLVQPGLTGWAQVNYSYAATLEENLEKLQYDLFYIKNRSLLTDLAIMLRTLGIILSAKGQ
ncbi:hypothetical protein A3F28_01175 [Candidatus Uhrbacteria bacterium RIFCSPHIGHO2_12_FULL_57_11]|uniref:Bacterial sugar transferase domain-containing protein n=2 Tax=Candidatus Uhriibacteriota TaxID=1752732 RepID=A0A1F7ULK6_9BACT|nr:MAG: hypothetical protein A3D72_00965 [Candidatus Uhrbacteria bacterium RIFCSPHIGHO2_02_FULL_57_19]OGL79149.1 MAG: hypothetical protein A3F28_01175 [Candidatus Uhrbacteria bacterium RIFCSPHIGHO2_12_FULL_57_11]